MRIAIDASRAVATEPTGIEYYSARIIESLASIDEDNDYVLYTHIAPPANFIKLPTNFTWKIIPFKRLWSQIRLPLALLQDKPDLLFIPAHVIPLFCPVKKIIVTIHDVAFEVFPEAYMPTNLWYQRYAAKQAVAKAAMIITPSRSTAEDLVKAYKADRKKLLLFIMDLIETVSYSLKESHRQ